MFFSVLWIACGAGAAANENLIYTIVSGMEDMSNLRDLVGVNSFFSCLLTMLVATFQRSKKLNFACVRSS